ncbi:hypothetical protein [Cupriavidus basilensis]|uniref:hypothetical protein n=1 Tax=Cupriavidus basilensis TaxID=68895 RepID=UPI0023E8739F|nr:hypothetical protein [Cupriavidus basilensis]MDF3882492.1 hypothetical protein [Cupriavidus basilensis]
MAIRQKLAAGELRNGMATRIEADVQRIAKGLVRPARRTPTHRSKPARRRYTA